MESKTNLRTHLYSDIFPMVMAYTEGNHHVCLVFVNVWEYVLKLPISADNQLAAAAGFLVYLKKTFKMPCGSRTGNLVSLSSKQLIKEKSKSPRRYKFYYQVKMLGTVRPTCPDKPKHVFGLILDILTCRVQVLSMICAWVRVLVLPKKLLEQIDS